MFIIKRQPKDSKMQEQIGTSEIKEDAIRQAEEQGATAAGSYMIILTAHGGFGTVWMRDISASDAHSRTGA